MITVDLDKAKQLMHDKRRRTRAVEFKPHDEVISKQIPGVDLQLAETARQEIRAKHDEIQTRIDSATSAEELTTIIEEELRPILGTKVDSVPKTFTFE